MEEQPCSHKWKTIQIREGDKGLFGIVTNLLFGGFTHYEIQQCKSCGIKRKLDK
jgi:hypothetical protein